MNKIISLLLGILSIAVCHAQDGHKKNTAEKVTKATENINKKSKEISDATAASAEQVKQAGENIKTASKNVKAILKIFEPIFSFHFKKRKNGNTIIANPSYIGDENSSSPGEATNNNQEQQQQEKGETNTPPPPPPAYSQENYSDPENDNYNADGTMNMGHQHSGRFGNCLNLLEAKVMGFGEAEEEPEKVDLIFLSQFGGLGYVLTSPFNAPTINEGVTVKSWREKNETEIAETKISLAQFEKITSNSALVNAVKNASGFAAEFYTSTKMEGRVFAIKLMQDEREVMALLAVYKQLGTSGSNGYLKIKIKVQGIDGNTDGYPDEKNYRRD